jgi:AGCS family alanine or glycine:cation symporter
MKINRITLTLLFVLITSINLSWAQSETSNITQKPIQEKTLSQKINDNFEPLVANLYSVLFWDPFSYFGIYDPVVYDETGKPYIDNQGNPVKKNIPFIVVWLVIGAVIFTIRMRFINLRGFKHAIQLVQGKFDKPQDKGEVSHFQALATALSGTVGLGNIAGVALAITMGGPGATFWMIVAGLLGMSLKFTEVSLGVKYRNIDKDGVVSGGPMHYLSKGLKDKSIGGIKLEWLGKLLAFVFSVLVVGASFGGGNMFQANQAFQQFSTIIPGLQDHGVAFGLIMSVIVAIVIIGGIKGIAKVTEKIVPFMALLYLFAALTIIIMNFGDIGKVFSMIYKGAFNPAALKGGVLGVLIAGFQRAAFSNEAGVGSASIAHSAVKTDRPVSEGIVALLEPFIDTVVICTMTALVIIFTGYHTPELAQGLDGVQLTSKAFESVYWWFPYILMVAIVLFAFSTMISWSYYGLKGFEYLFGKSKITKNIYFIIFLAFIIIGSSSTMNSVVDFSDMMILTMSLPNIIGLYILAPEVYGNLKSYMKEIKTMKIK